MSSLRTLRMRFVACLLFLPLVAFAQSADTGVITGRVLNPTSGQYVRNAQVRVDRTGETVATDDGGYYRISGLAPGETALTVMFTGYMPATASVNVSPGATAVRDFEIVSSLNQGAAGEPLRLDKFVVSTAREGNAKAIMDQRNSMNITNSVASDVFGDVAEGNVGEFLKNMPGIETDLVQGEIRTVRLRGLGSEYTQVTLDGVSIASADANSGAAGNARAFSFEQVSLSSVDSIEVSKTISADVDANAPAGTINLKTKHAFERNGRRVSATANFSAFSERFNFDKSYGPDDRRSYKLHPGGIFDYSDVFFNRRLGVSLSVSESLAYSANAFSTMTYNYTPTAADPRPAVLTAINLVHAPRTNRRSTVNLTTDFKASDRLVLSLGLLYNYAFLNNPQRSVTFNTGARNTVIGADPLMSFTTTTAGSVVSNPAAIVKSGQTITVLPRLEYRVGSLLVEGKFAASDSISWYDPRGREGSLRDTGGMTDSGIAFTAARSALHTNDWRIVQIAGPDISDGANYTNPTITLDDGRAALTDTLSGQIDATLRTTRFLPIVWKAGVKRRFELRDFYLDTESLRFDLIGAPAKGAWAAYRSPFEFDAGSTNSDSAASIRSASGGNIYVPDLARLGDYYRNNPTKFTQNITTTNFYNAFIGNRRHYQETIDSGYFMGTATIGRLVFRAGLRGEDTETDALDFNPLSAAAVTKAGYAVSAGRATSIEGLKYQYFTQPKIHRTNDYSDWFPSASLKYRINANFDAQLGFSSTIRRPTFRDIAGVWAINDDNRTVSAPNPNLTPETSRNYSARVAYYFEPVGIFAVNAFQNSVKGLFQTGTQQTAEQFGYTGPDLADYTFLTTTQSPNLVRVRGMEYEYSQSLSFLPQPFKGLNVRASYTRNYAQIKLVNMIPHSVSAGLGYSFRRANVYANYNWRDNYPTTITAPLRTFRHRADLDIGGGYRITERYNFFFSARNIFNVPFIIMEKNPAAPAVAQNINVNGINWTFGVKGVF